MRQLTLVCEAICGNPAGAIQSVAYPVALHQIQRRTSSQFVLERLAYSSIGEVTRSGYAAPPLVSVSKRLPLQQSCVILRANAGSTERRARYSNDRHAKGYKPEWGYFWRLVDVADGFGQWNSGGEDRESPRRDGSDGRDVIPATCARWGHGRVLCMGRKNWAHVHDDPSRGLGAALQDGRATSGHARRFHVRGSRFRRETDCGQTRRLRALRRLLRRSSFRRSWRRQLGWIHRNIRCPPTWSRRSGKRAVFFDNNMSFLL